MKSLEEESKEFALKKRDKKQLSNREFDLCQKDFIAGANSKWVQAEKIKAQIEILESCIEHPNKPGYKRHDIINKIKALKQLGDENKAN